MEQKSKKKLTVVKVGGAIVENTDTLSQLLIDFSEIDGHKVLVHGGGRLATTLAERLGIETQMINGRRITDEATLEVVTMVYAGSVNKRVVACLQAIGINALGLTGADMDIIRSVRRPIKEIDFGFVGDVKEVNGGLLRFIIEQGIMPVISPITHDGKGQLLNTNADTIASEVAKSLSEYFDVELIYCFEKKGVLRMENDDDSVIPTMTPSMFKAFVDMHIIKDGMIPKLENAFNSLDAGVSIVTITRADQIGKAGSGTAVVKKM
jgi:acetylglutamate kinase